MRYRGSGFLQQCSCVPQAWNEDHVDRAFGKVIAVAHPHYYTLYPNRRLVFTL